MRTAQLWKGYSMRHSVSTSRFQPMSAAQLGQVAGGSNAVCSNVQAVETAIEKATCCNPCVVAAVNQVNCCISQVEKIVNCL